jgi:hypothetical protein
MAVLNHIDLNYKLREEIEKDTFYLSSISSRQMLEDTYSQHLHKTGLSKRLKYKIILYLMYR